MKNGLSETELNNSFQIIDLSEREQDYILEHLGVMKLLFAYRQCCNINEYLTKTLKKNTSCKGSELIFRVLTAKIIRMWIKHNWHMNPKPHLMKLK